MRKSHVLGFGNLLLVGALVFAGCGGTSNPKDASGTGGNRDSGADRTGGTGGGGTGGTGGGSGGTGGGGTGGGTGGATDGGADRTGGTGGTDAGAGGTGGGGTGGTDAGAGGTGGGAGGTGGTDAGAGGTGGTDAGTGGTGGTDAGAGGSGGVSDGGGVDAFDSGLPAFFVPVGVFNADLEGFSVLASSNNLKSDGGAFFPTVGFDGSLGQPAPGSAKLTLPVTTAAGGFAQVDVGKGFAITNLSGRILTARVMLEASDGGITNELSAQLVFKSGTNFVYANGGFQNLTPGVWKTLLVPFDSPGFANAGYDATQIREVDVEVQGNIPATSTATAIVYIDTIGYQ